MNISVANVCDIIILNGGSAVTPVCIENANPRLFYVQRRSIIASEHDIANGSGDWTVLSYIYNHKYIAAGSVQKRAEQTQRTHVFTLQYRRTYFTNILNM